MEVYKTMHVQRNWAGESLFPSPTMKLISSMVLPDRFVSTFPSKWKHLFLDFPDDAIVI